mmetsp:Transcript_26609/g.67009  ORF Transcript_26609/g.67009 Transcript_26609/m.67009 type:complete len:206 (+) Transcript_26609:103-720(+)
MGHSFASLSPDGAVACRKWLARTVGVPQESLHHFPGTISSSCLCFVMENRFRSTHQHMRTDGSLIYIAGVMLLCVHGANSWLARITKGVPREPFHHIPGTISSISCLSLISEPPRVASGRPTKTFCTNGTLICIALSRWGCCMPEVAGPHRWRPAGITSSLPGNHFIKLLVLCNGESLPLHPPAHAHRWVTHLHRRCDVVMRAWR